MRAFNLLDLAKLAESIDVTNQTAKNQWRDLFHVYNTALNNPPEGVIGVGAITYAEQALAAFQKESN